MLFSRKQFIFVLSVAWAVLTVGAAGASVKQDGAKAKPGKALSSAEFFAAPIVRKFKIELTGAALEELKRDVRAPVRATVTVDGQVFTEVGVHLKGRGSFKPLQEKPSFTVKFDQFVPSQHYSGFSTLWLNNSSQDPTYMNELIGRGIYRDAGLPTSRVTHVRVQFNDRDLGLYVLIEPVNKRFLRQYFENTGGNLYKPYRQDIDQPLPLEGGSDTSRSDLKELVEAAREKDLARRWERLNQVLDVDGFLDFALAEMLSAHTDSYVMGRNNYFLFHDLGTGRFRFITHDLDGALRNSGCGLTPPTNYVLVNALMQIPEARWRYRERIPQLCATCFNVEVLTNRVQAALARLKADARNPEETRQFENSAENMRHRIVERARNISQQLAQEPQQLLANPHATNASPAFWKSRQESGRPQMDRVEDNGRTALHLNADQGGGAASWQARVYLPPGRYVFQGRVRTARVAALPKEPASGATLRAAGLRPAISLRGDAQPTTVEQVFEVTNGDAAVELACELRAGRGEAWFDLESLKVMRR